MNYRNLEIGEIIQSSGKNEDKDDQLWALVGSQHSQEGWLSVPAAWNGLKVIEQIKFRRKV